MAVKRVDNRNKHGGAYWVQLQRVTQDLFSSNNAFPSLAAHTVNNKKFVYGFDSAEECRIAVTKHNRDLKTIRQDPNMSLHWMVKHYGLRKLQTVQVCINYGSNKDKYSLSFKEKNKRIIRKFTFNSPDQLEPTIQQFCNEVKLTNLLTGEKE